MAEPDKQQIGDGQDNPGEVAQKAGEALKQVSKAGAEKAAAAGSEAVSNAAAASVQAGIQTGSAVSEIAAGTASGGPVGAVIATLWAARHTIFKIIVCICLLLTFFVTAVISLPSVFANSVFRTDPDNVEFEGFNDLYTIFEQLSGAVKSCVEFGYESSKSQVADIIDSHGYDYRESMDALIDNGQTSAGYDVCYILAAYSASKEQRGTSSADMQAKLKGVAVKMFPVTYVEKEKAKIVPTEYATYKQISVTVVTGKSGDQYTTETQMLYEPAESKITTEEISVDAYSAVSVDVPVRKDGKITGTETKTYYKKGGSTTVEPKTEIIKYAECTIHPFDSSIILKAFGIDPDATYSQFGIKYSEAIEYMAKALKLTLYGTVQLGTGVPLTDTELIEFVNRQNCSPLRKQLLTNALSLVGKVPYWWGGKSEAGWNDAWNTPRLVTAAGSSTTGTLQPYGLDCSGFTDWVYKTTIGKQLGRQWQSSFAISKNELLPGDLGFLLDADGLDWNHVLMYAGEGMWVHSSGGEGVILNIPSYADKVGEKLVYTIEVSNAKNASDSLENVMLSDTLTGYLTFSHGSVQVDGSTSKYTYDDVSRNLSINLGNIAPGEKKIVTFECEVNDTAYGQSFRNTVVMSADNEDEKTGTDDGVAIEDGMADMGITKSVSESKAKVGDNLVYTIQVSNAKAASVNLRDVILKDTLSEFLSYTHGSVQIDGYSAAYSYDSSTRDLSVKLGDIAPGQTKKVTFECTVNSTAYGKTINNTAIASADNDDDKDASDKGVTIEDGSSEGSAGSKTVSASTAKVGDTLTYTITLRNATSATAEWKNAVVTDVIPEYFTYVSGSVEEDGRASTNSSYDAATKTLKLFADNVGIGEEKKFSFKVTVEDGAQGRYIVNTAVISSDGRNDIQLPDTGVQIEAGQADPMVSKTASVTEAHEGDIYSYTVKLKNGANATASWENVIMTDILPDGLKLVSGSVTLNGKTVSYGVSGQAIEVTVGALKPNEESIVKFEVRVLTSAVGTTITNVAVGKGDNGDKTGTDDGVSIPDPGNNGNPDEDKNKVTGSKTVDKTVVKTGDKVTFTIKAINNSQELWESVHIYDVLDTSMITLITDTIYIDGILYPQTSGKWIFSDKQLVFNLDDITAGQEVICSFSVEMKNDAAGQTYINSATIKSNSHDNVYVKAPEILILEGDNTTWLPSEIHYRLFAGHGDANGNPTFLWTPNDNITINHMCNVGYRLMSDYYRKTKGNGTITVKRGMMATLSEFCYAAEYLLSSGNRNIILCERGIRTFDNVVRNMIDIGGVAVLLKDMHIPVFVDISHSIGERKDILIPIAKALIALGVHGLMVETHCNPTDALSDSNQQLTPIEFDSLFLEIKCYAETEFQRGTQKI